MVESRCNSGSFNYDAITSPNVYGDVSLSRIYFKRILGLFMIEGAAAFIIIDPEGIVADVVNIVSSRYIFSYMLLRCNGQQSSCVVGTTKQLQINV